MATLAADTQEYKDYAALTSAFERNADEIHSKLDFGTAEQTTRYLKALVRRDADSLNKLYWELSDAEDDAIIAAIK